MCFLIYIYPYFLIFHDLELLIVLPSHSQLSSATSFPAGPRGFVRSSISTFDD